MSQITYPVTFNAIDLATVTGLTVLASNPYAPPKRRLTMGEIVQTSKSKVNSGFYTEKEIVIRVGITRSTRALVEQSLDSLMTILQGLEKELIVLQSNSLRKYIATLSDVVVKESGGSYLELELVFTCSDRFGYDLAPTLIIYAGGYTSATRNDQYAFGGSADMQLPVWTITYTSLTGGTAKTVTIGNATTNQTLSINRTWATGDVLVIDGYNRTVKVNGVDVDYSGSVPYFEPNKVSWITYSDDLTTRTLSYKVTYVKRFV